MLLGTNNLPVSDETVSFDSLRMVIVTFTQLIVIITGDKQVLSLSAIA